MQTQNNPQREKPVWSRLCQCLGLLLFSLILTACSQGADPQQGVISDDKLNAPLPKAISALSVDETNLIVEVVVNGDTDNPMRIGNLVVDATMGTFSGDVSGIPAGTSTLSLVYSIDDPSQGKVEVIRTSDITIDVVVGENTPADFSSAEMIYTDTDGDGISNLDELENGTSIIIPNYTVGGQIQGLTGSGLVLQNNEGDDLPISSENGTLIFTFSPVMIDGSDYTVTVLSQPNNPNQICTVNNGNGTVNGAAVSNVTVTCSTTPYAISGTVSGYIGSGLVLQNNNGDDLSIDADGTFSFSNAVADGSQYAVSVQTQPGSPNQICTVNNSNGTVNGTVVSNITVTCSIEPYTIGGTISGYMGSGLVLQNNNGDDLPASANGTFNFSSAVADGSHYTVAVLTQPSNPNQICTVNNGSGTVSGAVVSNITVTCSTTPYVIGGMVSGYAGSGLVLQNNGSDDLAISANGIFSFSSAMIDGSDYIVTVRTQPNNPNQICTVNNGSDSGTVSGVAVSSVSVTCSIIYNIGGTVSGYAGSGLILQNNDGDDLPINTDGNFTFTTPLTDASTYAVTVFTQPDNPNQTCVVNNDKGTINSTTIINVTVTCVTTPYMIKGTVTGLVGGELVLQNNDGDDLLMTADGDFTFATALADGSAYVVTVLTPPAVPNQRCTVENSEGFLDGGDANVTVSCRLLLFIRADDGVVGRELFATDGTAAGTSLVKDINANISANPRNLVVVGGVIYFVVEDDKVGPELWKTNGAAAGTVLVKNIPPDSSSFFPVDLDLTAVGSTLYFHTYGDINGRELWKSDGTDAGTVLVKDIRPGLGSASPDNLTAVGSTLYFSANDGTNGTELWKSDGTAAGTVLVKDIRPGSGSASPGNLTAVGSALYFSANDGSNGTELWKSDGTAAGTVLVKDIRPGSVGTFSSSPDLTAVGSTLYFSARDGTSGRELWKSDGTDAGTVLVKDIQPGLGSASPDNLTAVGSTLYFSANDGTNGTELWKSDGTAAGTVLVKDIRPGSSGAFSNSPPDLTAVGSTLYFSANDGTNGVELWKSDGTDVGTILVNDINTGDGNSFPDDFSGIDGVVYFAAYDGVNGRELWRSDGSVHGTYLLADIGTVVDSSTPSQVVTTGGTSYFIANNGRNGRELWKSDGTAAGTVLVKDIRPGSFGAVLDNLTAVGSTLYFSANDGTSGSELWKSDGTDVGTVLVKDIRPGSFGAFPDNLTAVGSTFYFRADDGINGRELWKSDGTDVGTVLVKDIRPGSFGAFLDNFTAVGSTLYFRADDGINGRELWKSDGTDVGTVLVKDILPGSFSASLDDLTAVGSTLYFRANDGELWKSDGTDAGTVLVKDIRPGSFGAVLDNFTAVGSTLYFRADDGRELWKSDGTDVGTVLVKDIRPGSFGAVLDNFTAVGSTLYFRADDGINGRELWKSDGTDAGTVLVKDILPGSFSASLDDLTAVGSTLYFRADDGINGVELWKSDGTEAGTVMVKDLNPNFEAGSNPVILNMN